MSYQIIKNFLSVDECKNLLKDAEKVERSRYEKTHDFKRETLSSGSIELSKLIEKSINWNNLNKKINSQKFLDQLCEKLQIKKEFNLKQFFGNYDKNNKFHLAYKKIGLNQITGVETLTLLKYLIYRIYRSLLRSIKFFRFNNNKMPIELLYDFSKAYNGYENKIHRDTDFRVIIILIYLNELDTTSSGGELKIFKNISKTLKQYPDEKEIELVEEIKPEPGKMVVMLNNYEFFHSTKKLEKLNGSRNFIYGGFTLLSGKNPYLKHHSSTKSAFHHYD